jgi:Domain of unknown function (DUF4160)
MEQDDSDEDVRRFVLEIKRQWVTYRRFLRSQGNSIDEKQLAESEEEIHLEEERLGESEKDFIGSGSVHELQQLLAFVDLYTEGSASEIKALLLRLGHTKVRMRPEHNHSRPHFHIEYKQQYSASYAVDTLERMAGNMPKKYEAPVLEWAAKYQHSLAATWERLNAGEDVRELVIVRNEA